MNIRLAAHFQKIWRKLKVEHRKDSIIEIFGSVSPFSRGDKRVARNLTYQQYRQIKNRCIRRCYHLPLQYVVGLWSFRYIKFKIKKPVFIPRFQTEQLITILKQQVPENIRFLELCCGSGVIGISLVKELKATGVALDIDERCTKISQENLKLNGFKDQLKFITMDMEKYMLQTDEKFNLIVGNPPYINQQNMKKLPKEVADHENRIALYGGPDGLTFIRKILELYDRLLLPGGTLALEYAGQILPQPYESCVRLDFYNNRRFIIIKK